MRSRWPWFLVLALAIVGALAFRGLYVERPRYVTAFQAIRAGDLADLRYHLSHGTDISELDDSGYTLLHSAAAYDRPEAAELVLSKGLDPDTVAEGVTVRHYTALHVAARANSEGVAELLLKAGANPNALDTEGLTPLHVAALHNSVGVARALLENRAQVNARDDDGQTPLGLAIKWQKASVGRLLVQYHGTK